VSWNKSWMDVADLFLTLTISNQPVIDCWIYHCECKQRVCFGWCRFCKWMWLHQINTDHDPGIQCQILLFWVGAAHIYCIYSPSLSFDILDKWNINGQCSISFLRSGHVMVFLKLCSVLVCPGWSKYSWYQEIHLCCQRQWLMNAFFCYLCKKSDHILQYVLLSNEVELSSCLLILVTWLLIVLWRPGKYASGLFIWYYWCCFILILREVLIFLLFLLEYSGYQYQDGIKYLQQYLHFYFLGDTKMLFHILQGLKANA
jgi:hypothetical protein